MSFKRLKSENQLFKHLQIRGLHHLSVLASFRFIESRANECKVELHQLIQLLRASI